MVLDPHTPYMRLLRLDPSGPPITGHGLPSYTAAEVAHAAAVFLDDLAETDATVAQALDRTGLATMLYLLADDLAVPLCRGYSGRGGRLSLWVSRRAARWLDDHQVPLTYTPPLP